MTDSQVPIGRVKRDISDLINRVAYRGERIVLTSRGKPKAALVSIEDYQRLITEQNSDRITRWKTWLAENRQLTADILRRRNGEPLDVDALWEAARADLEERDDQIIGR